MKETSNGFTRELDAIVAPYVARPLTLAVSATIDTLNFDYSDQINEVETKNKLIFGATDGRIIVNEKEEITSIESRNPAEINNATVNIFTQASDYGFTLSQYTEVYDSYVDDNYNLLKTIWSIEKSPKQTFIPSWRYIDGISANFSTDFDAGNYPAHHIALRDFSSIYGGKEVILSSETDSSLYIYDGVSQSQTYHYIYRVSDSYFTNVNAHNFGSGTKILTTAFGDLLSDNAGTEFLTFAWYKDPLTFNDTNRAYDENLLPIIW